MEIKNIPLDLTKFDSEYSELYESTNLEFKTNMSYGIIKNIHDSICAFLNRNGGHVIIGIDNSRKIVGIDPDQFDKFIIDCIDSITHQSEIVQENKGNFINPFLVRPHLHKNALGKYLCIVEVQTDLDLITSGVRSHYRLKTGESYFRLYASNYKVAQFKHLFLLTEANSLEINKLTGQKIKLLEKIVKQQDKYTLLNRKYSDLEVDNEILSQNISRIEHENKILKKKLAEMTNEVIKYRLSSFDFKEKVY